MAFLEKARPRPCLVEGCSRRAATQTAMQVYLWHRHIRNTMVILEEGSLPHPLCPLCDMMVSWWYLNGTHRRIAQYKKGEDQKIWRLAAEEERAVTSSSFSAYGHPLDMVTSFKYLERVISATEDDWSEVVRNLAKAHTLQQRLTRILSRKGAAPQLSGFFFKSVV